MEVLWRHARTRAITRGTVFPANRADPGVRDASQGVARVVSDVSVLCPPADADLDNAPQCGSQTQAALTARPAAGSSAGIRGAAREGSVFWKALAAGACTPEGASPPH